MLTALRLLCSFLVAAACTVLLLSARAWPGTGTEAASWVLRLVAVGVVAVVCVLQSTAAMQSFLCWLIEQDLVTHVITFESAHFIVCRPELCQGVLLVLDHQ